MKEFFRYFPDFFRAVDKSLLLFCSALVAILIFLNYHFQVEQVVLAGLETRVWKVIGFFSVYLIAFALPYLFFWYRRNLTVTANRNHDQKVFFGLVLLSPLIFSLKVNFIGVRDLFHFLIGGTEGEYWGLVANLPSKLALVLTCFFLLRLVVPVHAGLTIRSVKWKPYLLMLLAMIPLIAWASTQPDFLRTYPKLKQLNFLGEAPEAWRVLLYEISYGVDFITIELFFRGFLVLTFVRFVGVNAILPMAVFYCSIHFGKPLMECVSSFFGGILLGVVVYRTRSIAGGLIVHLGIAWMMEIGGMLGHRFTA